MEQDTTITARAFDAEDITQAVVQHIVERVRENNHTPADLSDYERELISIGKLAPGTFGKCADCGAYMRYYFNRPAGEAYSSTCRIHVASATTNLSLSEVRSRLYEQYATATLNDWASIIYEYAKAKGWWDTPESRNMGDLTSLLHTEVSEAYEQYRDGHTPTERHYNQDKTVTDDQGNVLSKPEGIPSELADLLIRVFDICGYFGIDILDVVIQKYYYNLWRPYRHGGKVT